MPLDDSPGVVPGDVARPIGQPRFYRPVRWLVRTGPGEQLGSPTFAPDGRTVAYSSWTTGGYRDLFVVSTTDGSAPRRLWRDRSLDIDPRFSGDGRYLYFSSDRSGIYNLYAYELARDVLWQVTELVGGAFEPRPAPDGRWLVFSSYSSLGFDLAAMRLDPTRFRPALPAPDHHPQVTLPAAHGDAMILERGYRFYETFRPQAWSFNSVPGSFGQNVLFSTSAFDAAGLHAADLTIEVGTSRGEINQFFNYTYLGYVPSFTADFRHFTLRRGSSVTAVCIGTSSKS
jgi:hypothetical protein